MQELSLRLRPAPARSVPIRVGPGALNLLAGDIAARPPGRLLVVVSDSNAGPLYGEPLCSVLRDRGFEAFVVTFCAGETSKTRETKAALEDELFARGVDRDAAIVAVGGGVTSDLAGFLAATWHRGIPVVQAPTSLLAMVDAALGGKTAVDLPGGKNLVGAFHQPWGVYADIDALSTLSDGEYAAGFAEVVKSACVADPGFFRWLEASVPPLLGRDPEALEHAVAACLRFKARVVRADERESGRRAILNFGHTVGHALEAASGYVLPHGPAVAVGMVVEASVAVAKTGLPLGHVARLRRLLGSLGLPTSWPPGVSAEAVLEAVKHDKKNRDGLVRCALPRRLGRMLPGDDVTTPIEEDALRTAIEELV